MFLYKSFKKINCIFKLTFMSLFQKNYLKIENKLIFNLQILQIIKDNNYQKYLKSDFDSTSYIID